MIWFALLIPFIFALGTWVLYHHKIVWWEVALPFVVSLAFVLIAYELAVVTMTTDTEYWTGWVTKAEYYESWTEEYTDTETYTDSDGDTHTRTVTKTRFNPASYYLTDSAENTYSVDRSKYKSVTQKFGNEQFEDIWRFSQVSFGDGNKYYSTYPGVRDRMVVSTTVHTYENRIQNSNAVFHFEKVRDTQGLYEYPYVSDETTVPSILGAGEGTKANIELCRRNAELGSRKQVRVWILLFPNAKLDKALDQERYWKGGNKNEMVVCIGTEGNKVSWAHVFSWCENEKLKIDIRNAVREQSTLDLNKVVAYTTDEIEAKWVRKKFADFKYISISPPFWATVTTIILTLLLNVGLSVFVVMNQFDPGMKQRFANRISPRRRTI